MQTVAASVTDTRVYRISTDRPDADGTIGWDATTLVAEAHRHAAGDVGRAWSAMVAAGPYFPHAAVRRSSRRLPATAPDSARPRAGV